MTTTTHTPYETRYYHPDDEPQVLDLLRASLGEPEQRQRTSDLWRWKHMANPFGPSLIRVAVDPEGRIIGLRAFLRWRFRRGDQIIHAMRPVDTATHPDHQRRGIFARLTTEAIADARDQGVTLIYNTPNPQSLAGYLKLGWHVVGTVRPLIRVLNPPRFALGLAKHRLFKGRRQAPYPPEAFFKNTRPPLLTQMSDVSDFLPKSDTFDGDTKLHTDRTPDYLQWRYADHPTIDYRALQLEQNGQLAGYAIIRTNTRFGLREIVLSELLIRQSDTPPDPVEFPPSDYVVAYYPKGSVQRAFLNSCGFRSIPIGGMTLAANEVGESRAEPVSLKDWGVALGDLEFF